MQNDGWPQSWFDSLKSGPVHGVFGWRAMLVDSTLTFQIETGR